MWTHRDPLKLVPSTCSVMVDGHRRRIPDWEPEDPSAFGHEVLDRFSGAVRAAMASRATLGDDRFIDIAHADMNASAVGVARRIYDFAGLTLAPEVAAAMQDWAEHHRAGSRGKHAYSAEQYGLSEGEILEAFAGYLDVYGDYC